MFCEARSVRSSVGLKISARVRRSSVTSNTLWANLNFFGQIIVQRYFVFVPTVELRTLYIQELPYMNTFCESYPPTSGDLKSGDSLFCTTPPPHPRMSIAATPPFPPPPLRQQIALGHYMKSYMTYKGSKCAFMDHCNDELIFVID